MCLQCRPIKCADLHLLGCSREGMLWKEGAGVHPAITELPLPKGELGQDSYHRGQGHLSSGSRPQCRSWEWNWGPALMVMIPSQQAAQAVWLEFHKEQLVWCHGCPSPRAQRGAGLCLPLALLFRSGAQHQLTPGISISREVSAMGEITAMPSLHMAQRIYPACCKCRTTQLPALYARAQAILCQQTSERGTGIVWIKPHAWAMPAVASPAGSTEGPRLPWPAAVTPVVAAL